MGGGVVRTTARRDFLEFGTRVTIHQPLDIRSVHVSTGFAPNINEVHMLDAEGNAVQQINRIRITKWEEKRPRYISPYKDEVAMLTSPFAYRSSSNSGAGAEFHAGYDFATGLGTPLYSIADGGEVIANRPGNVSGQGSGYGRHVIVKYNDPVLGDFCAMYAHMREPNNLKEGTKVDQGDLIGNEGGTTGTGIGAIHLHFQTWPGSTINYNPHVAFDPLVHLYGLEMTKSSIEGSGMFILDSRNNAFSWNTNFLAAFPTGRTSRDTWGSSLDDLEVISNLEKFLESRQ